MIRRRTCPSGSISVSLMFCKENRILLEELEILKKATAFFAKQGSVPVVGDEKPVPIHFRVLDVHPSSLSCSWGVSSEG
jgi:hypothetical protein